jgi:hypothetical protein
MKYAITLFGARETHPEQRVVMDFRDAETAADWANEQFPTLSCSIKEVPPPPAAKKPRRLRKSADVFTFKDDAPRNDTKDTTHDGF